MRKRMLLALGAGAMHATSFAPDPLPGWALPLVQCVCMAVLVVLVWRSASARRAARLGFAFGVGTFSVGLYWLHISVHVHGAVAWPLAALAVLLLAAFEALYYAVACALAWYLSPRALLRRLHVLQAALAWASSWALLEWLRGTLLTGFPWLNVAYAHIDSVFAAWASILGAYGVTWFVAFTAAALAWWIVQQQAPNRATQGSRRYIATLLRAPVLWVTGASALCGMLLNHIAWEVDHGPPMMVRLVQGNVPQSEKFDAVLLRQHLAHYRRLAALPPRQAGLALDLIVLPETVIPILQDRLSSDEWQHWRDVARMQQATLLMGVPVHTVRDGRHVYTNSVVALDAMTALMTLADGTAARYDKAHLVPFGEFIPPGFRWFVAAMAIPLGDFDRGAARQRLFAVAGQTIAPNICYEDVFGVDILPSVRPSAAYGDAGASVLINVSNLAWFGDSWALRQHLQMARMRAMETRRPMLRATNTGMTAAISPRGALYAALPAQQAEVLDVSVQGTQGLTPYVRWGNVPILVWLMGVLLMLWVCARRGNLP